jgi:hypothetical protein
MPRLSTSLGKLGYAPGSAFGPNFVGQSPYEGQSPFLVFQPSTARHSLASHPAAEPSSSFA